MMKKAAIVAISMLCLAVLASAKDASETIASGTKASTEASVVSMQGRPFEASADSTMGASLIVIGLVMGADDVIEMSVQNIVDGSKATIAVSASVVDKFGVAAGRVITAVSEATGYSLIYSGQILAFIPNTVGASLLEHNPVSTGASIPAAAGK